MNARTRSAVTRAHRNHAAAAMDTATTLWFRLPILFAAPTAASMREWERAVTEKVEAAANGALAATFATQRMGMLMATGLLAAEAMPLEMMRIAEAFTAPGFAAVSANARRLSKPKSRRRT